MPLYEYECEACGQRFEKIQKFSDPPLEVCAKCGKGPIHKLLSSPAIQFKGTGWYITDYSKKSSPGKEAKDSTPKETAKETKESSAASESTSASKPAEKKD